MACQLSNAYVVEYRQQNRNTTPNQASAMSEYLTSAAVALAASGVFSWLFQLGVKSVVERGVQKDLEHYKNQLNEGTQSRLEQFKTTLQQQTHFQVESFKAELAMKNEDARHELQKQMLLNQLVRPKTQDAYASLMRKVRRAHGSVSHLIVTTVPTYEEFNADDIKAELKRLKARSSTQQEVLNSFQEDKRKGISEMQKFLRRRSIFEARRRLDLFKNYILLNELFMAEKVVGLAWQVYEPLSRAQVRIEINERFPLSADRTERVDQMVESATARIEELRREMVAELNPRTSTT
ncbi:hypothetical protein ACN47A_24595 [Myxococcus fulvus]|uniref:hypothetical protein n=1 Tax=Myxococcus fulvus TaxID=33 RepID=UPI003B9BABAF